MLRGSTVTRQSAHLLVFRASSPVSVRRALNSLLASHDGVTGLFVQQYHGAREHGTLGFGHGIGKCLGGFVLKDLVTVFGPFAYNMRGVHKEIIKGRQPTAFIQRARQLQGGIDVQALDAATKNRETAKIEATWKIVSEIQEEDEALKEEGVKRRIIVMRDRQRLEKRGTYENLSHAKQVLAEKQDNKGQRQSLAAARSSSENERNKCLEKNSSIFKSGRKSVDAGAKPAVNGVVIRSRNKWSCTQDL